ncbi:MAG: S1 RNA-binding domain-containing protein [Anaerolineae bacterium]|nr:S1 RNA-binding domain-containing protein [Anaerolineae bacterium]MDW8099984.1 S1 RNA-binding domain-containing protein [Anaerolineae bacterium]
MSNETTLERASDIRAERQVITEGVSALRSNGTSSESPMAEATPSAQQAKDNGGMAEVASPASEEARGTEQRKKRRRRRRRRAQAAVAQPVEIKVIPPKKIIKPLKRGMEVTGVVRRLTDFGAFIDIGVGTDGLAHISELSVTRVNKVSDVLQEGQQVTAWIKDLDREHNRISLTLIPPGTKTIRNLQEGEIVRGKITRLTPYGAFVDIGVGREAMLHVREMAEGYVAKPEDVVRVGEELEARVIAVDRRRQRIDLSLKGLRPEPVQPEPEPVTEFDLDDDEETEEIPSVIALAFQKALGEDFQDEKRRDRRQKRRRRDRDEYDEEMEEILSRTLRYRDSR